MRGYPISSFLFWELKPENRDKWQVYKFLEEAQDGGTHNRANTEGQQLSLVLDGQQRLTSLMIGLKGNYIAKKKYKRWDNPDAWSKQRLHLDLFADPLSENDSTETGIYYQFPLWNRHLNQTENDIGFVLDVSSILTNARNSTNSLTSRTTCFPGCHAGSKDIRA